MGVCIVQEIIDKSVWSPSDDRLLKIGPLRIHDSHIQMGRRSAVDCGVCAEGLDGALAKVEAPEGPSGKDAVVEGHGGDGEGDAAPPLDNGAGDGFY